MKNAVTVKQALTPQKGGFLAGGFTHTLNPFKGCGFGRTGCSFCYVRESPLGKFGTEIWGHWTTEKTNIAKLLERELRRPGASGYRVFMSSATDPYQPLEAQACLSRNCLEVFQAYPVEWLVIQTRSLLVRRDFDLISRLSFATLNVSIETDLLEVHQRFTRSSATPERRLHMVKEALDIGITATITVSPHLPSSPCFAERLAAAVGDYGRVIVDTFINGDGSGGRRSVRLGMQHALAMAGYPGWFERCHEHAHNLQTQLARLLGADRVLYSSDGFTTPP